MPETNPYTSKTLRVIGYGGAHYPCFIGRHASGDWEAILFRYENGKKKPIKRVRQHEDKLVSLLARRIAEQKGITKKQAHSIAEEAMDAMDEVESEKSAVGGKWKKRVKGYPKPMNVSVIEWLEKKGAYGNVVNGKTLWKRQGTGMQLNRIQKFARKDGIVTFDQFLRLSKDPQYKKQIKNKLKQHKKQTKRDQRIKAWFKRDFLLGGKKGSGKKAHAQGKVLTIKIENLMPLVKNNLVTIHNVLLGTGEMENRPYAAEITIRGKRGWINIDNPDRSIGYKIKEFFVETFYEGLYKNIAKAVSEIVDVFYTKETAAATQAVATAYGLGGASAAVNYAKAAKKNPDKAALMALSQYGGQAKKKAAQIASKQGVQIAEGAARMAASGGWLYNYGYRPEAQSFGARNAYHRGMNLALKR